MAKHVDELLQSHQQELKEIAEAAPMAQLGKDQHSNVHRWLYDSHHQRQEAYHQLCSQVVKHLIKEPCYVQQVPTYRVGFPGNRWVGSYHRDSDFGHPRQELNLICAFTPMAGSAALQVERSSGSYDYHPLELKTGEMVMFDHIGRLHGCARNRTGKLVLSIDFRFIPERFAKEAFGSGTVLTINTALPLNPGGYFSAEPLRP